MSIRQLFLKNAAANILGGVGGAVFNLLLPALAVRHLTKLEFSVWSLSLQIIVYIQLFGFGLQTAITRFIAHSNELNDLEDQLKTIKAGIVLAFLFVMLAAIAVLVLAILYPLFFENLPKNMVAEFRTCVVILGVSAAWQLFALIPMGLFVGRHSNIIPVGVQLLVRVVSLFALWIALLQGAGLLMLSAVLAVTGALLVPINLFAVQRFASELLGNLGSVDKLRFRELLSYCGSLAIWNIANLLVNGVNIVIVGYYDFENVGAYSLASTVVMIMVGLQQAVMSPLLPTGAKLNVRSETRSELARLLIKSTKICLIGLFASFLAIKFLGVSFLQFWLGSAYTEDVYKLLLILALANLIRNTAMPYALLLLSVSLQKQVQLTVLVEGVVNLIASFIFAKFYGAIGIAYGAVVGVIASSFCNYFINFKKTRILVPDRRALVFRSFIAIIFPLTIVIFSL